MVVNTVKMPPQSTGKGSKFGLFGKGKEKTVVTAIVIKPSGLFYDRKVLREELPDDARVWKYKDSYIYSLIEYTGDWLKEKGKKYDMFEPTGASEQLPATLWRAIKAAAIRKVFTYKSSFHEKLNLGLGIAFVCICIFVLFILIKG